jgi:hypothetical protein
MAAPYTSASISGYNSNPPSDDGSQTEANRLKWSTIKEKLPDPIKTLTETINTNVVAAFAKIIGGADVSTTGTSVTVTSADQGKLIRATAASITVTTPDATDVDSPFWFALLNSSSGTITLDGNGSQTVNGLASVTIPVGGGCLVATDGSNWFAVGLLGVLAGKQLGYADIINGTIAESNATNAVTFALKTLAGADPSSDDPVLICFRNATAGTGNYVYRTVTAALSLTIPSTATMGCSNATPFDIVLALFDDGGTIRLGAINPFQSSDKSFYALDQTPPTASSTTVGTGSDSAKVWYTGTGVTSKPYVIVAICKYSSGLVTAGSWNVSPTTIQLFGRGVALPNTVRQVLHVRDEKASGTAGGTATSGSWETRDLNTTVTNDISGASLASNQITLPAGIYSIEATVPARGLNSHKAKLRDTTGAADLIIGTSEATDAGTVVDTRSVIKGRFVLAASSVLEIQHQVQTTKATTGHGSPCGFSVNEVYTEVIITKLN